MTDEQFRALGELSVYFAILDEEITIALCRVITCSDTTLATKALATMNFRGKLDAIRTALDCMDIQSETARSAVEDFRDLIGEVQRLSDARNRLMHFHVELGKSGEDSAPAGEIQPEKYWFIRRLEFTSTPLQKQLENWRRIV